MKELRDQEDRHYEKYDFNKIDYLLVIIAIFIYCLGIIKLIEILINIVKWIKLF